MIFALLSGTPVVTKDGGHVKERRRKKDRVTKGDAP
jgi:hypothetical protein